MALPAHRQGRKRDLPVFRDLPTARATNPPDIAVNFRQLSRPRGSVQAVHVLGDEPELFFSSFQFDESLMGRIWRFGGNQFTSPVVPFPDQSWVTSKSPRGREIFRSVGAPQAVRPAKGRHAAIRRNSSSREDGYVPSGSEVCAGEEDLIVDSHGRRNELYRISSRRICVI